MTNDEKIRQLLKDLQAFVGGSCRNGCTHWGCQLRLRIDAALQETE